MIHSKITRTLFYSATVPSHADFFLPAQGEHPDWTCAVYMEISPTEGQNTGSQDYSGSQLILVSKILDCTQQPFMVVAEELFCPDFHVSGSWERDSIQYSENEWKSDIWNPLITPDNPDERPS